MRSRNTTQKTLNTACAVIFSKWFYYCDCDSGWCQNVSCVPLAPSFSDFLPLASILFIFSQSYARSSLEIRVLRANRKPMGHGDFLPFLSNTDFTKKETYSMCWVGGSQLLDSKDPKQLPAFPPTLLDQMPLSLDSHTLLFFPSLPLFPLFSCRMWGCLLYDLYRENQPKVIPNPPALSFTSHFIHPFTYFKL